MESENGLYCVSQEYTEGIYDNRKFASQCLTVMCNVMWWNFYKPAWSA